MIADVKVHLQMSRWGLWLRCVDPSLPKQEAVVSGTGKTTPLGWESRAHGLLRGADERAASHSCWLHIWEADLDMCWLQTSATSCLSCSRNHSEMIPVPLIMDATTRRRVHSVPKGGGGGVCILLSWFLELYANHFGNWMTASKRRSLFCFYQHQRLVAVSHLSQAHTRLTFSFWSGHFGILVLYCATFSFLSTYLFFIFLHPVWKTTKHNRHLRPDVWIEIRGHRCLTCRVIYIHRLKFFFFGCLPSSLKRKITDWQRHFCSSFKIRKDWKNNIGWVGGEGKQLCSFRRFITNLFPASIFIIGTFDWRLGEVWMWLEQVF